MTDEQHKSLTDLLKTDFGKTLNNQVLIRSLIKRCEEDYWDHTHVNVRNIHAMVSGLVDEVAKLRQQVSRLEQKLGQ
jgi:hypothetical protein